MKARGFFSLALTLALILGLQAPAHAVTVCFDYVIYRLTLTDPRPVGDPQMQGTNYKDVTDILKGLGYKPLPGLPAGSKLEFRDVIFIGTTHVGFVAGRDSIDHFLQVEGTSTRNKKWDASNLPKHGDLPIKLDAMTMSGTHGGFFFGQHIGGVS